MSKQVQTVFAPLTLQKTTLLECAYLENSTHRVSISEHLGEVKYSVIVELQCSYSHCRALICCGLASGVLVVIQFLICASGGPSLL